MNAIIESYFVVFRWVISFPSYCRFVGERNREEATRMMESLSDGTFLIRVSNQGSRRGEYALSVRSVEYTEKDAAHRFAALLGSASVWEGKVIEVETLVECSLNIESFFILFLDTTTIGDV
jgi:hypothetical protein